MKKLLFILFTMLAVIDARCNHIIGGEIFYDCTGNNVYQITLRLYRDCNCTNCAAYGNPEYVTIFDGLGNVYTQVAMPLPPVDTLSAGWLTTCNIPPGVCVEEAYYTGSVMLPPSVNGYTIVYQRCCRSIVLANLVESQGATFTAEIPGSGLANCNSSARFGALPPMFFCANSPLTINCSATDPDGDSLVYDLCDPYTGASGNCPDPSPNSGGNGCPTYASPPPYGACLYNSPYSSANFTNFPSTTNNLSINPATGIITGTPGSNGLYDVTVCVGEYRNGQLLNTLRRDYQLTVIPCVKADLQNGTGPDTTICAGDSVLLGTPEIANVKYQWQGDPSFISDTDIARPLVRPGSTTTYYLVMTDTATSTPLGCRNTITDAVTVSVQPQPCYLSITSVPSIEADVKLYPNPAKNAVNLLYNIPSYQEAKFEIYDQLGQLVIYKTLPGYENSMAIQTNQLPNGVYNYRFMLLGQAVKRDKFVIIK